jgi:ribosome-associated toxin RatA of RatAB toxin-antitoxin module
MPHVETTTRILNKKIENVWETVSKFEQYPEMMDDILEVRWESKGEISKSAWRVLLNGSEMSWIERDEFIPFEKIVFEQIEGDLEVFRGEWHLVQIDTDVVVTLEIEFDIGIPSLADILNPIGIRAIQSNSRQMLAAIQAQS